MLFLSFAGHFFSLLFVQEASLLPFHLPVLYLAKLTSFWLCLEEQIKSFLFFFEKGRGFISLKVWLWAGLSQSLRI